MNQINNQLTIKANLSELDRVLGFLETQLEEVDCPLQVIAQICISVEEIFVNIVNYAYPEHDGDCKLELCVKKSIGDSKNIFTLCITDFGMKFDPLKKDDPDITLSAEDRQIGGLGIWMVKQSMDSLEYEYENNQNKLTLIKSWDDREI